jgi:hypothetical protein
MVTSKIPGSRVWLAVLLLSFCETVSAAAGGRIHVMIPEPASVTEKPGNFYLRQGAMLAVDGDSLAGIADWVMVGQVKDQTGITLREEKGGRGAIIVRVGEGGGGATGGKEGYTLTVSSVQESGSVRGRLRGPCMAWRR